MRFSLVAAVFFLASALFADTVILKNGQTIFGNIVGQTRTDVQINVNGQVITLQKEAIRRIQYGDNRAEIERQQKEEEARRLEAERVAREEAARRQNADVTKQKEAEQERKKKEKEADAAREAGMRRRFAIVGASAVRGFYQAAFQEQYTQHVLMTVQRGGIFPGAVFTSDLHDRDLKGGEAFGSLTWNRLYFRGSYLSFHAQPKLIQGLMPSSQSGPVLTRDDLTMDLKRSEAGAAAGYSFVRTPTFELRALALFRDEIMNASIRSAGASVSTDSTRPFYGDFNYDDGVRHRAYGHGGGLSAIYNVGKLKLSIDLESYRLHGPWGLKYKKTERSNGSPGFAPLYVDTEGTIRKTTSVLSPAAGYEVFAGFSIRLAARFEQASYQIRRATMPLFLGGSSPPDAITALFLQNVVYNGFGFSEKLNRHDSVQYVSLGIEKKIDF